MAAVLSLTADQELVLFAAVCLLVVLLLARWIP